MLARWLAALASKDLLQSGGKAIVIAHCDFVARQQKAVGAC